jgi:WD40 repeat protein
VLTGSDDRTARIWDAETGEALYTLIGHQDNVVLVAYSPDGR